MRLVLDDTFLPAILNAPQMTDEDFANFCGEHPDLFFEMTADGELIVTPPTHSLTGTRNTRILAQLEAWAQKDGRGTETGSSDWLCAPERCPPFA